MSTKTNRRIRLFKIPEEYDVSISTVRRWVKDPDFPPAIPLGPRAVAYELEAIDKFLRDKYGNRQAS